MAGDEQQESVAVDAEHDEVWADIPWLVNGTLDAVAAARAWKHIDQCDACRFEYQSQTALRDAIAARKEPAPMVDDLAVERALTAHRLRGRSMRAKSRGVGVVGGALAAALVVMWFLSGFEGKDTVPADFRTITERAPAAVGALLRARTAPQANEERLRALFQELSLSVVEGPSEGGVWLLRASEPGHVETAAQALEEEALVDFVARARP